MHITTKNTGRKLGTTAGAIGGGVHGFSSALAGARVGYRVLQVMGPPGMALGTIAGAVLGAIVGASSFGFMGAKLGELVDNTILDNYRCLDCGKSFNPTRFMAEIPLMDTSVSLRPDDQTSQFDGSTLGDFEGFEDWEQQEPLSLQMGRAHWPVVPYEPPRVSGNDSPSLEEDKENQENKGNEDNSV